MQAWNPGTAQVQQAGAYEGSDHFVRVNTKGAGAPVLKVVGLSRQ